MVKQGNVPAVVARPDLDDFPPNQSKKPRSTLRILKRLTGSKRVVWSVAVVSLLAAIGLASVKPADQTADVRRLTAQLSSARASTKSAGAKAQSLDAQVTQLQSQVSTAQAEITSLQAELDQVKASKIRTVIQTKTVTKKVPTYVPNGKGIEVDVTGYEGQIEIHDVQLTHAYGFSDFVGVAINKSGDTISYAEIGCTFLDSSGKVLANEFTNKTDWPDGASWGFDCTGGVNATGGTVRVDELS